MTFSEADASDVAQELKEEKIQEIGETKTETLEIAETAKRFDQATYDSVALVVNEGNYQEAEETEKAFVAVIEAPVAIIDTNDIPRPESSGRDDGGDIGSPGDDSGPELQAAQEFPGEDDGQLDLDDGVEQVFEPHKVNQGDPNSLMKDVNRMEDVGYQGEASAEGIPPIEKPGDLNVLDGLPGGKDRPDGADLASQYGLKSTPEIGETWDGQSLADAAAPGGDPTISAGTPGPGLHGPAGPSLRNLEHELNLEFLGVETDGEGLGTGVAAAKEELDGYGDTYWAQEQRDKVEEETGESTTGDGDGTSEGTGSGDGGGGSSLSGTLNDIAAFIYWLISTEDPTNETGAPTVYDPITGEPIVNEDGSINPIETMMQPVGEDDYGREKPLPMNLKQALESSLDPLINWGDSGDSGLTNPSDRPSINVDADEKLTGPDGGGVNPDNLPK